MKLFILTLISYISWGQTNLTVASLSPTQAVISYNSIIPCTIELSESNSYSPVLHDVNSSLFTNAATDILRANTYVAGGKKFVVLGKKYTEVASDSKFYSRALPADTVLYLRVTCGSTSATATLTTPPPLTGMVSSEPPLPVSGNWGNSPWPSINFTSQTSKYIDPLSGATYRTAAVIGSFGAKTASTQAFSGYFGGTSWTNPSNVISAGSTVATTNNTNPIYVFLDPSNFISFLDTKYLSTRILEDLGVFIWAGGDNATASNRQFSVCLTVNSVDCYTNAITVTAPQSAAASLGVTPSNFPTGLFNGWGVPITVDYRPSYGTINVTNGTGTIASNSKTSRFDPTLAVNSKIFITGSSPTCTNNICNISGITSSRVITLTENLTISSAAFYTVNFGVKITKATATGNLDISVGWRAAGTYGYAESAEYPSCSTLQFTNGDGKTTQLCYFQLTVSGSGRLFAVTENGDSYTLAAGRNSSVANDQPSGVISNILDRFMGWSTSAAKDLYVLAPTNGGQLAIFKGTYTGNANASIDYAYTGGPGGDLPASPSDPMTWTNLTPSGILETITSGCAAYNASIYGALSTSNVSRAGVSGDYATLYKFDAGQDSGPAWIFVFKISTGELIRCVHTLDGQGTGTGISQYRWGALHSVGNYVYPEGTMFLSLNPLQSANSSNLHGGPFEVTPSCVYKSGSCNANTSLPFPVNATYNNTCPYESLGATGTNCVTLQIPGEPCNLTPTTGEKSSFPCTWDANGASPATIQLGDIFVNKSLSDNDSEHFRFVKKTSVGGGVLEIVVQRDAIPEYCNATTGVGNGAVQDVHANGWVIKMMPGQIRSCATSLYLQYPASGTYVEIGRTLASGHFSIGKPSVNNELAFVGVSGNKDNITLEALNTFPVTGFATTNRIKINNVGVPTTTKQSYIQRYQNTATGNKLCCTYDVNALNPSLGLNPESEGNDIGAVTITNITGNIYKVSIPSPGSCTYKTCGLMAWAGKYWLSEQSSATTGDTLGTSDSYKFCYALRADECRSGSSAGDTYVNVPLADTDGRCATGQSYRNEPCVIWLNPQDFQLSVSSILGDTNGQTMQRLGMLFSGATQYPYAKCVSTPSASWLLCRGTSWLNGLAQLPLLVKIPSRSGTSQAHEGFTQIPINIGASTGMTHARVRFGYGDTAGTRFYCTTRAEECLTDGSLSPFAFAADSLTEVACSPSCTINVPGVPGKILYYRVERKITGSWRLDASVLPVSVP